MTGLRESQLLEAASRLLNARRTLTPIPDLPAELIPTTLDEVFFVQNTLLTAFSPENEQPGGWKVGAPSLESTPLAAPLPKAWITESGSTLAGRLRGLEAEIAFLLKSDLPPRDTPYTDEEVYTAVQSCHPAIEVLESGLIDPTIPSLKMSQLADLQMHGGLVLGAAIPNWQSIDFHTEHVTLAIDGILRIEATGSNTSGNLLRLLPWLANAGAVRTGGLLAGQWITTGSWTGATMAHPNSAIDVHFNNAGRVTLRFE